MLVQAPPTTIHQQKEVEKMNTVKIETIETIVYSKSVIYDRNVSFGEYVFVNASVIQKLELEGKEFNLIYTTGGAFHHGNVMSPTNDLILDSSDALSNALNDFLIEDECEIVERLNTITGLNLTFDEWEDVHEKVRECQPTSEFSEGIEDYNIDEDTGIVSIK